MAEIKPVFSMLAAMNLLSARTRVRVPLISEVFSCNEVSAFNSQTQMLKSVPQTTN